MAKNTFSLSLAKFAAKAGANADAVVRKVAADMLGRIVLRSPVDTGRFRANWQLSIGSAASGTTAAVDKAGGATIGRGVSALATFKSGPSIWLVNNLPYGEKLEYGYSRQAPSGMVRITVREFQGLVSKAAQQVTR